MNADRTSLRLVVAAVITTLALAAPGAARAAALTADLSVTKQFNSPIPTHVGDAIDYTITIANDGPDAASNVVLTDTIPSNTTFLAYGTGASGIVCTTPPVGGTGTITCPFAPAQPSFASGDSLQFIIQLQVATAVPQTVDNTATVSSDTPDPNPDNDNATVSTPIAVPAVPVSTPALLAFGLALAAGGIILLRR